MLNDVKNELGTNFIEYAVAVNTDRALPDAKSGLKPVAKRILWSAFEEGRFYSKPHVKSARIVGDVMGKYHPHGDSSIYLAMVRLSQNWSMRYPLIDWHGSNGNISGDGPAASRYTESKLSKISEEGLLFNIKKKNVEFIKNYDETLDEPVTLPAIFPNLLCNPNSGIGVAMACSWAPHNLSEVAEAIYNYMDGKEPMLPGPDFPTGGVITNKRDIPLIMKTGKGTVKVRGKYTIEKNKIIFYEIPYGISIEEILQEVGSLCEEESIIGISDIHDETNKKGLRIVISCERGFSPESIVKKLFLKTSLQSSFSYNQIALVDKVPTELNLKSCIKIYLDHNIDCLKKEFSYDLNKAETRLSIINGLLIALDDIDNVIHLIKTSSSSIDAKEKLIKKYCITENQADAILAMKLSSLAKLESKELKEEKEELIKKIDFIKNVLSSKEEQIKIIRNRLSELVKKYGDKRRTELLDITETKEEKIIADVTPEDVVVLTTQSGLIKRVPASGFKIQRRGGKGVKSADEIILDSVKTNTIDTMMFFSDKGKMYRCVVDNIPASTISARGSLINDLIKIGKDEKIIAVSSLYRKSTPKYIIFITKNGMIKKSLLEEYTKTSRNTGISAIKINECDTISSIVFQDDEDIILATKKGKGIRFKTDTISILGRAATGVKAIKLEDGDEVIGCISIHKSTDMLGIFAKNGQGKKFSIDEMTPQGRGGKGVIISKQELVGIASISDEDNILISGEKNSICVSAKEIPVFGKSASGNILIKDTVTSITKI